VGALWPDGIEFIDDVTPASWIAPRLLPWGRGLGTRAGAIVPTGYPSYVRILHRGRRGHTTASLRRALASHLAGETGTPQSVYFGIWEGWGLLHPESSSDFAFVGDPVPGKPRRQISLKPFHKMVAGRPTFELPYRAYLLAHGSLEDLPRIPVGLTPSLIWPEDRAFCCATEIDLESTLVGLSKERAQQLLDDENLEALPVGVEDRLDIDGDPLSRQKGPPSCDRLG
jgi:hypothetical protein